MSLPYKVATLLYCFNERDEILLLERAREPNRGFWSPCGGKLKMDMGESPHACACREAREEAGLKITPADLHLTGLVSEHGYQGRTHWLMFLFEVKIKLKSPPPPMAEGRFEFFRREQISSLKIPQTDAEKIWPWFWRFRGGFFAAHCHCHPDGKNDWTLEEFVAAGVSPLQSLEMSRLKPAATNKIRAEAPIIDLHSDDYFIGEALRQAARACEKGEVPVGAVVVREGRIITRAFNQVESLKDATAHAEMLALTQAENAVGDWRLTDCTLYVTKEPCPMCAGAIVHTRLARVVFGAADAKGGAAGGALNLLQFPTLNHRCEITSGVRREECRALLQKFFAEQRQAQKLERKKAG